MSQDVLAEIGLEPRLEIMHSATAYFTRILPPAGGEPGTLAGTPRHPNVFMSGWLRDCQGARNFIEPQFACGEAGFANRQGWCDPTLEERMDEASALQVTDPTPRTAPGRGSTTSSSRPRSRPRSPTP
jgi:hypothetical protein